MAGSSFGNVFKLTTFGESHGPSIGGIIEGCPPNFELNLSEIQAYLDRRKTGQNAFASARKEEDEVVFLSGIYQGKTTGTPIGFNIKNKDARPEDYDSISTLYRPSHADFTYEKKYGLRDPKGGGRSSARETACRVVAGAIAAQILASQGILLSTYVDQIGSQRMLQKSGFYSQSTIDQSTLRCPDHEISKKMEDYLQEVKAKGDTAGGCIQCVIHGVPAGLGEPIFDKIHADLGKAMLSINAVKGFEIGSGFDAAKMLGSEHNDLFNDDFTTQTNFSGGIQGGITNGMPIYFRVAFKPVATLMQKQTTVNAAGQQNTLEPKGRHDACVVPRAVPIVESMAAIVILDHFLRNKTLSL